ncbi:probable polyamine transporter At3g13620 [Solanum stenotomum]|uniref:probable polyamine transporter At3g13620 n=1 Tax=Solanum stenotomum TaxID=172797 RepID=UPI0020D086A3|nr:probable polyamine transporter At3g13620 [Solanum stenotomum]
MKASEIPSSSQHLLENEDQPTTLTPTPTPTKNSKKLALIPLIFIIFFEVSGGPYGAEAAIGAAGPLLAILGFLIFPFIWSVPEALVTAELATTFPGNGGFVIWADKAFGPFWGSLMGSWKLLSAVCNLASYPVLCLDYIKLIYPILDSGLPRYIAIFFISMFLSFLNYLGLSIVGYTAVVLGVLSLCPFWLITLFSIPKIDPSRWLSLGQKGVKKDWNLFFNTLFWNLNFWDNASTLAGEVEQPQKTFPKALFSAGIVTCISYVLPLLGTSGAVPLEQGEWIDGYFANLASMIAGNWLKYWMELGIVLSVIGLYEAQLSSCAYQILGMAEMGLLPRVFGVRSEWFNTPWVGILVPTLVALVVSYMTFTDIVSSVNFLYSLGMLLEFASFLWLRRKMPKAKRPYRVPLSMPGLLLMCFIPSCFLVYVMFVAHSTVYIVSALLTAFAIAWYFFMEFCKTKMWFDFETVDQHKVDDEIF